MEYDEYKRKVDDCIEKIAKLIELEQFEEKILLIVLCEISANILACYDECEKNSELLIKNLKSRIKSYQRAYQETQGKVGDVLSEDK